MDIAPLPIKTTLHTCHKGVYPQSDDSIEKNSLKPSHSWNTYPVRFKAISYVETLLKTLGIALDQDVTCQICPLRWTS